MFSATLIEELRPLNVGTVEITADQIAGEPWHGKIDAVQLFSNNGRNLHRLESFFPSDLHVMNFLRDAHVRLDRRDGVANRCSWCGFWIPISHDHLDHIDLDVQIRLGRAGICPARGKS